MDKKLNKRILLLLIISTIKLYSQVNFEPVNNSVYGFLERMSQKGIIQLNEEFQPYSRKYIAEALKKIEDRKGDLEKGRMSGLEKEEFEFYIREFSSELRKMDFDLSEYEAKKKLIDLKSDNFGFDKYNRLRLFSYDSDKFSLFVDPVLSYNYKKIKDDRFVLWSNGIKLYGNFGSAFAFDLQFYDNHYIGNRKYFSRNFSPETGYEFNAPNGSGYDFDRMNANLSYSWEWGSLSIGKDFNYYGNGEDGKLIMSDKAPSFPHLKLEVAPVDWLRFSYIHGFLNSQILDSSTFRYSPYRNHVSAVDKYFVTHMLSINPFPYLNLSLGESIIYSDKFQPVYLIPIAFFRFAEHYFTDYAFSDPNVNAGNAQIFANFWYKSYTLRTKIYGSFFLDELSTRDSDAPQALGYSFGFKSIDPIIPESELTVEYTRINPFVYSHADSAQTYASYGYELGHWIGSNADELFVSFRKRIFRGLNFDLWVRYIQKGNEEDISKPRYQVDQTFLWGNQNFITMYGAAIKYELLHSFNLKAVYEYSNSTKNHDYLIYEGSSFKFGFSYGM